MKLGASQAPFEAPKFSGVPGKTNKDYVTGRAYNGPVTAGYDRLLISPAHYAVAVYAALIEAGRLSPESLFEFNVDGSTVEQIGAEHSPGFELTTGSFGQAISQAGGIAFSRKLKKKTEESFCLCQMENWKKDRHGKVFRQQHFINWTIWSFMLT